MNSKATAKAAKTAPLKKVRPRKTLGQRILENWQLYLLLIIPIVITIIYKYIPMYGIQIAFRDYKANRGFFGSKWVGWYWFERFFTAPTFQRMIVNTVKLSLFSLLWSFPVPIILSLAINQLRFKKYKRVVQTVLYAPHFISIMVVCGIGKTPRPSPGSTPRRSTTASISTRRRRSSRRTAAAS